MSATMKNISSMPFMWSASHPMGGWLMMTPSASTESREIACHSARPAPVP